MRSLLITGMAFASMNHQAVPVILLRIKEWSVVPGVAVLLLIRSKEWPAAAVAFLPVIAPGSHSRGNVAVRGSMVLMGRRFLLCLHFLEVLLLLRALQRSLRRLIWQQQLQRRVPRRLEAAPEVQPINDTSKHLLLAGSTGTGFMPHIITVQTGEDVSAKIMEFSQQTRRAICVLSANGAIANASLRQTSTSGGIVTYEGRFEVLSLSGSFLLTHSGGQQSRTGGLSVSLAGPDGHVIGGGVASVLIAASPVQVIVGSFTSEGKKETGHFSLSGPSASGAKDFETLASLAGSFSP